MNILYRIIEIRGLILSISLALIILLTGNVKYADSEEINQNRIKTFQNFCSPHNISGEKYDFCIVQNKYDSKGKTQLLKYELISTTMIPSRKYDALIEFCDKSDLQCEDMFLHLAEDTSLSLPIHSHSVTNVKKLVKGWDDRNDRNGDGVIDDQEFRSMVNGRATARKKSEARLPIYYWGPPNRDFVMNVGNIRYGEFCRLYLQKETLNNGMGIFIDTLESQIPGDGRSIPIYEYPDKTKYISDIMQLLQGIISVTRNRERKMIGNGWLAEPLVIDGTQWETSLNIFRGEEEIIHFIKKVKDIDRKNHIQLIQYNPYEEIVRYLPQYNYLLDEINAERDRLFGLALYYSLQGNNTYFGIDMHPYATPGIHWFDAISYDLGNQVGEVDIRKNGIPFAGIPIVDLKSTGCKFFKNSSNSSSIKSTTCIYDKNEISFIIKSTDRNCNIINERTISLKPNTSYTLEYTIKVNNIVGSMGAEVYLTGFEDVTYLTKKSNYIKNTNGELMNYRTVFKTGNSRGGFVKFRLRNATGEALLNNLRIYEGSYYDWYLISQKYTRGEVFLKLGTLEMGLDDTTASSIHVGGDRKMLKLNGYLEKIDENINIRNREALIIVY